LALRKSSSSGPDAAIIKRIQDERLNTEKGLQLCVQLSQHIDQIQLSFPKDDEPPHLTDPGPTSKLLVSEGLDGCKEYVAFALQRLEKHRQKVADRLKTDPTAAISSNDKILLEKLQGEADTLRHGLKFFSNVDSYLEEQISNIENHAEGDDITPKCGDCVSSKAIQRTGLYACDKTGGNDPSPRLSGKVSRHAGTQGRQTLP
jgi:hypothetical protein